MGIVPEAIENGLPHIAVTCRALPWMYGDEMGIVHSRTFGGQKETDCGSHRLESLFDRDSVRRQADGFGC